jgi:hypothetical protein
MLPIPLDTSTRIVVTSLRISLSPQQISVSQPELNAHPRWEVHRLAISLGWLESYLSSGLLRGLVEPVAKPADDAAHLYRAIGLEYHLEDHVTLES